MNRAACYFVLEVNIIFFWVQRYINRKLFPLINLPVNVKNCKEEIQNRPSVSIEYEIKKNSITFYSLEVRHMFVLVSYTAAKNMVFGEALVVAVVDLELGR